MRFYFVRIITPKLHGGAMKKLRVTIKPAGDKWQASAEDDNAVAEGISPQEALGELIMQKGRSINVTVYERNHEKIVALLMA